MLLLFIVVTTMNDKKGSRKRSKPHSFRVNQYKKKIRIEDSTATTSSRASVFFSVQSHEDVETVDPVEPQTESATPLSRSEIKIRGCIQSKAALFVKRRKRKEKKRSRDDAVTDREGGKKYDGGGF